MNFPKNYRLITLSEEVTVDSVKTTYVGKARIPSGKTITEWSALAKWQVTKYVETTAGSVVTTLQYRPEASNWISMDYEFIRDNRASLTYK